MTISRATAMERATERASSRAGIGQP
jgi:hypothetical protein